MTRTASKIRCKAKLFRPADSEKNDSWTFLIPPKNASAKLPSRGMTTIEGTINGFPFQAAPEPDGQKSHWLKVDRKLSKSVVADGGDRADGKGNGTRGAERLEESTRRRRVENARSVVGRHAYRPPRLDLLDYLRQTARDAPTPDQKCLLDARRREAARLLFDRSGCYSKSLSAPKAAI